MMSPMVVLEAFGIIMDNEPNEGGWSLKNEGAFDILTKRNEAGRLVKRVHVYACDYLVHKIEYFDDRQKVVAVAELGEYKPVSRELSRADAGESHGDRAHEASRLDQYRPDLHEREETQRATEKGVLQSA